MKPSAVKSIDQSLKELDRIGQDELQDIQEIVSNSYERLKTAVSDLGPEVGRAMSIAKERSIRTVKNASDKVNNDVHQRPWGYLGAAAVAFGALGYFMGRRNNRQ